MGLEVSSRYRGISLLRADVPFYGKCALETNIAGGVPGRVVFQTLSGQLLAVLTFGFGGALIAMFPLLKKESRPFAWFSAIVGVAVWLLLLWFTFGNPMIRNQILRYGLH